MCTMPAPLVGSPQVLKLKLADQVPSIQVDQPPDEVEEDDGAGGIVTPVTVLPKHNDVAKLLLNGGGSLRLGPSQGKYGNPQASGLWNYVVKQPYDAVEMQELVKRDPACPPFEDWPPDHYGKPVPPALFTDPAKPEACGGTTKSAKPEGTVKKTAAPSSSKALPEVTGTEDAEGGSGGDEGADTAGCKARFAHQIRDPGPPLPEDQIAGRWTIKTINLPAEAQRGVACI